MRLHAATGDALATLREDGDAWSVELALAGSGAQCVAADPRRPELVYAGTRERGLWRSGDGGASWEDAELPEDGVFSVAVSPVDGTVYAGCEPSRLWRSDGGGWRPLDALLELPSRPTWSFPPRPWTSHVRWIAPSPHDAALLLVGIELGGLMRSADGGETWEDHRPGAQRDVHQLAWHPLVPGRAYEAGGGGAAWSDDGGVTWHAADEGRDRHYTWAVLPDPDDPGRWLCVASTGPRAAHGGGDAQARLYVSEGGAPWRPVGGGFPDPSQRMVYALARHEGRWLAGLADGSILASGDRGESWRALELRGDALTELHALVATA